MVRVEEGERDFVDEVIPAREVPAEGRGIPSSAASADCGVFDH